MAIELVSLVTRSLAPELLVDVFTTGILSSFRVVLGGSNLPQ